MYAGDALHLLKPVPHYILDGSFSGFGLFRELERCWRQRQDGVGNALAERADALALGYVDCIFSVLSAH